MDVDFKALKRSDKYRQQLPGNVWLMDNHKWALHVWAMQLGAAKAALIHADWHWDTSDPYAEDPARASRFVEEGFAGLEKRIRSNEIDYASFIGPALRLGIFETVHFYCLQGDEENLGLQQQLCDLLGVTKHVHPTIESLAAVKLGGLPVAFDLCLDLFAGETQLIGDSAELWSDKEIVEFVEVMSCHIREAKVVTVSLSFDYSGDEDDTRHLAQLVVPKLLKLRS